MKALISLMLVTSIVGAQEVRQPQRGEERGEPNRVERPEPVRVQPQPESPRQEQPPRRAEPRPEPPVDRPVPPMGRPDRVVILDPWVRNRGIDPWIMILHGQKQSRFSSFIHTHLKHICTIQKNTAAGN